MKEQERKRSFEHIEQIIVQQQFWFSATMLGVNGFLISSKSIEPYSIYTLISVSFLNLFALFLITTRAASHADKIHYPERITKIPKPQHTYKHNAIETYIRIKASIKHIPFMILEFSGALFYTLLVLISYIAFLTNCKFNFKF